MKVPDEFVDAMQRAAGGSIERLRMERALQAVLPKVRERLLDGETCRAASAGRVKAHLAWLEGPEENVTAEITDGWTKAGLEAAFDHAFPEEES